MKWRLMLAPARSGCINMARDEGLMDRARQTGEAVLSVYSWERPTLSLGRNQSARNVYDLDAIERGNMDVVRRPTGGRALLHHREVTYSVTAPLSSGDSLGASYRRINALLIDALGSMGVVAREADTAGPATKPGDTPCFAEPSPGELVWEGQKLVGSAQVREDEALLQHGSILVGDDQALIASISITPPATDVVRAATLTRALGRSPGVDEVAEALFRSVIGNEDASATVLDEAETRALTERHLDKYASDWWTWRR